jgi:hypothetical protein
LENQRQLIDAPAVVEAADLIDLLSWTKVLADAQTSDPAQWDDWMSSVEAAIGAAG